MQQVIVQQFGDPEVLDVRELETPPCDAGEVRVRVTSIGLNHADLMGRAGQYKASTGEPPFTPGIEAGGVIESVGAGVDASRLGQRVSLAPGLPRAVDGPEGGTYRSHIAIDQALALPAPDAIPDDQLGAIWLPYLTVWGCLAWKDQIEPGDIVGIPAASSSVGLAASQVVKDLGGIAIGLTSSPGKADALRELPAARFDHLVITHDRDEDGHRTMRPWHREIKAITDGHGVDVYFDPVAAGDYLSTEVRSIAKGGRIYIYGLLGRPGPINLSPMILRGASLHGWLLDEIVSAGEDAWRPACDAIFERFASGIFEQHIADTFALSEVRDAHQQMQQGRHIGKLVLIP